MYDEPIRRLVDRYIAGDDAEAFTDALDAAFTDPDPEDPERVELTLAVDSEKRVYEYQFSPITDGESVTDVAVASREITAQKARERQLERQNERLDRFASVVGHDLRNPLHLAASRLELAREECNSNHVVDALDAIERSQTLVSDVVKAHDWTIEVTESTAGGARFEITDVDRLDA